MVGSLTNGVPYTFVVAATNDAGTGPPSVASSPVVPALSTNLPPGAPFGSVDSVVAGVGSVSVSGWAIDPDTTAAIAVQVYVDGNWVVRTADGSRPDVGGVFPGYGSAHGFSVSVPAGGGVHTVCVYGLNVGAGSSSTLGCRSVTVPSGSPFGSVDSVVAGVGSVSVSGWAIDPDTTAAIAVQVYVDGNWVVRTADGSRPDVGGVFPGYGSAHGFSVSVPAGGGVHTVCVYGLNVGAGSSSTLGCRSVTVPCGSPFGSLDLATRNQDGSITVAGWSIDPDTTASTQVSVYLVGPGYPLTGRTFTADAPRPDVGAVYPLYGPTHGYTATLDVPPTPPGVTVCAYGIDKSGVGGTSVLGCRVVP